ncbi:unnamed protein product [Schistosoma curassoni]|uniref:CTNNB1 binding N-teminal domain-containing protein n=1 Tax=Schistosoma curassoni TaxID=6186 RepID=A0A183K334_9TREM|nr:unnamed protein product [Schistosoma curassoni]
MSENVEVAEKKLNTVPSKTGKNPNSRENMLNESNYEQKSDAVLIDADFSNDPSLSNDILNKFEENISEESSHIKCYLSL